MKEEKTIQEKDEDVIEIDWMDLLRRTWACRRTLLKAAVVGLVIGCVVAFSMPRQYTVSVVLSPEAGQTGGNLSGLASMVGLGNMGMESEDALGAALSADIVGSTPFLLEMFNVDVKTEDGKTDTTLVAYLDEQSRPWWGVLAALPGQAVGAVTSLFADDEAVGDTLDPFRLTKEQAAKVDELRQNILADVDKKTGKTTLSVTLQDPVVAATVADSVASKLQEYIIDYRSRKAQADCDYLEKLYKERQSEYYTAQQKYAVYVDANQNVILQSVRARQERLQNDMQLAYQVYSQVATQLQVARAKVQEAKPVFAVVEPATVPLHPSGMSRKVVALAFAFLACAGTLGWLLFGRGFWNDFRSQLLSSQKQ
mgnify:CR=1 FL=1